MSDILNPGGGAVLSTRESELDRYRALLRGADDEPKRLALIQLLIDEGARDKLAAKRQKEQLPEEPPPLLRQASAHPDVSSREAVFLEGSESAALPLASEDVASLISNLLIEHPAPPRSATEVPTHAAPSNEIEKQITNLLKGLSHARSRVATSGSEEDNAIVAIRVALEGLLLNPNKTAPV
jgi:hypothetical protein